MSEPGATINEPVARRSGKAVAAFAFALSGLFLWGAGGLPAILFALQTARDLRLGLFLWIFGFIPPTLLACWARRDLRQDEHLRGRGLANAALVLALVAFVLPPLFAYAATAHDLFAGKERIVHFHLAGTIEEAPQNDVAGQLMGQPSTFFDLLRRINDAKEDPSVLAAIVTTEGLQSGLSEMEELRAAFIDFASSGKKVYMHCEDQTIALPLYLMLGAASRLSIAPTSWLNLSGLYNESMYLKEGLAKVGVEADVVRIGDYKAASEMFSQSEPSTAARENMNSLFDSQYQSCINMLAESRRKTPEEIKALIDRTVFTADRVAGAGLVDAVEYQDDVVELLKREYGPDVRIDNDYHKEPLPQIDASNKMASFVSVMKYFARLDHPGSGDAVGLIYVNGAILSGYGGPNGAFSGNLRAALKEAMENDSIKAVVLRMNTPGGSAVASEIIHQAVTDLEKRKPLVVSMGKMSASGGYDIACAANQIFADETTVTGSIGVISTKLVMGGLWEKLGVDWTAYPRGANADMFEQQHPYTEQQRAMLVDAMQSIYATFKGHVTAGRGNKLAGQIDDLAGGRIFTGKRAMELGLVDRIGGLQAAIAYAAQSVSLDKYEVHVIPEPKNAVTLLLDTVLGRPQKSGSDLGTSAKVSLGKMSVLAGLPEEAAGIPAILQAIDPRHAKAGMEMFTKLQLLQSEGAALVMSEILVDQ